MRITLQKLTIENFKGIKHFELNVHGCNTVIGAENGIGKTSCYDAFLWALFGKDSTGRKDFQNRPLDADSNVIAGLVVAVEAVLSIDDKTHTYRKEEHERNVKDQVVGYTGLYWVDGVPIEKKKDYEERIQYIIDEDTFKMLTDLNHFNGKLHWTDRRQVLMDIAGNVGTPTGFEALLALFNGRTVDEMKAVLGGQKKGYVKERDEIGPRIDEIQRGLDDYVQSDSEPELIAKRDLVIETGVGIGQERAALLKAEQAREFAREKLRAFEVEKVKRETFLANDTSATEDLQKEAAGMRKSLTAEGTELEARKDTVSQLSGKRLRLKNTVEQMMLTRKSIQEEYTTAKEKPATDTCYACGQTLQAETLEAAEKVRQVTLDSITQRGNKVQADIKNQQAGLDMVLEDFQSAEQKRLAAQANLLEAQEIAITRFAEIEAEIAACPRVKPEDDEEWNRFAAAILVIEKELGDPVANQLAKIETRRQAADAELKGLDESLLQSDNLAKAKLRVAELDGRQKELSQKIADCDKQLADIQAYKNAESDLIAAAVNNRFKHVEFKLFKENLNGSLEDCCEALFKGSGVPYSDMSTGQQIICGVDVVNVLSTYYAVSVPLFVDHSESLTLPLEAKSQTIELRAVDGVKVLLVTPGKGVEAA